MNVTQLNTLIIKKDTNNRLNRGMRCYKEGLVLDVKSIADREYGALDIYGKVMSENDINVYSTNLSFDLKKGDLIYTECNCIDFENNCDFNSTYICKHIGATFYKFEEAVEEKIKIKNNSNKNIVEDKEIDYSEVILKEIDRLIKDKKEKVNLKINISKKSLSKSKFYYELDLKIGTKRYYVVKNISDLINARKNNLILSYGKEFKYNPRIHYFSEDNERVLNFIEEYVSLNEPFEKEYSVQRITNNVFGSNKTLFIPQSALRRFLNNIKNESISFTYDDLIEEVFILKEDLPIKFNIKEENNEIKLCSETEIPKPITYKGDVYLYDNKLYLPSLKQVKYYKSINDILHKENSISFKNSNKQKVINRLIPLLEIISDDICIDEELNKNIVKEDLKLEVYFDRERNKTWAEVKAIYGEISFDILNGPKDDEYVIRDIKEEEKIEEALNYLGFYRGDNKFIFNGSDEKLFELLSQDLSELKEKATIFYSDRFKERRIYGATSINAKISEGSGNYLEFTFNIENVNEDEYKKIIEAFKENRKFFKLKDENFIDLRDEEVRNLFSLVDSLSEDNINSSEIKVHKSKSIFLNEYLKDNGLLFVEGKDIVKHIANKIENLEEVDYNVPKELKAKLRDYQLTGFKWFKTLSHYEFGGILADEMGLGKTVQTIAFLLSEKNKKSIIVTPTSLIYNWRSEFEKFAPTMKIKIVHGNKEEREFSKEEIEDVDVLITSYGTLRNDYNLYEDITFDFCIIDEGQNIKNPLSQSSEVVKGLKAKVKFALTGTPIENNLIELWSLFDYILPGYLYSKRKFQEKFIKSDNGSEELKKLIKPFILRRLKNEVMSELPDKIEKRFLIEMTEEQKKVYKAYVDDVKVKMKEKDFTTDKITIFSYLTKLRQLTLDPSILIEGYTGGSGKIDVAVELIENFIKENHKILLFSQFTSVLDSIKKVLEAEGIEYFYLDGSTKASERVQLVNEFNNSNKVKIFLISLKAGGTGLNLTSADIVIHFDPWWNPAIEDQATDRAHRFGQKNVVEVIKLISKGSIEEKIIKLQESKKEIINEIMSGNYTNGGFLSSLSADEIKDLFN